MDFLEEITDSLQKRQSKIKLIIITYKNGLHFLNPYIEYLKKIDTIELKVVDEFLNMCNDNSDKIFYRSNYDKKIDNILNDFKPDIIFCEWASYLLYELSLRKKPHQKLICRMHRFDFFYCEKWNIKWKNVDLVISVAEYFKNVLEDRKLDYKKIITLNNYINFDIDYEININNKNIFNIGIIGIESQRKRLDLALEILIKLRKINENYKLFSKGHNIKYTTIVSGLDKTNYSHEEHSEINNISVNKWITNNNISHIISVSDSESFHYSIISAIENNCNYYITNWVDVAKTLWSKENIYNCTDDIVNGILKYNALDSVKKMDYLERNKKHCVQNFSFKNEKRFYEAILL